MFSKSLSRKKIPILARQASAEEVIRMFIYMNIYYVYICSFTTKHRYRILEIQLFYLFIFFFFSAWPTVCWEVLNYSIKNQSSVWFWKTFHIWQLQVQIEESPGITTGLHTDSLTHFPVFMRSPHHPCNISNRETLLGLLHCFLLR